MRGRLTIALLAMLTASSSSYTFTDSVWIVGARGYVGDLVTVEVWLQYEGYGPGDSISLFDIPLTYDGTVCTVETIEIGSDFLMGWEDDSKIDNQGTDGPPAVSKISVSAWSGPWISHRPVPRGTHLAATVDFRILDTVVTPRVMYIDTLMRAFSPPYYLGFMNDSWDTLYTPSFSGDYVRVIASNCGDVNLDGRVSLADATYLVAFIYRSGPVTCGQGDVNLDGRETIADATYIVWYTYRGGPPPCEPPVTSPPTEEKKRMER